MGIKPSVLIVAMGVALASLVGYNMIHVPQQRQVRVIREELLQEQARQRTTAEIESLLQQAAQYGKRLPEEADPSWLVRELMPLAEQTGVQVTGITKDVSSGNEPYTRLTVSLDVQASYHQLGMFVSEVERSDRFIRVERIRLAQSPTAAAGSSDSRQPASVGITFSTFYVQPAVAGTR